MTIPLPPSVPKKSQSITVLLVKVTLFIVIILLLPQLVKTKGTTARRRRRLEKKFRTVKWECERDIKKCGVFIPEESAGCISECISKMCHDGIYAANPLEDGEVDLVRDAMFERCAKKELKGLAKAQKRKMAGLK